MQRPAPDKNGHAPSARGAGRGPSPTSTAHSLGHSQGWRFVTASWQHSPLAGHECFAQIASAFAYTACVSRSAFEIRGKAPLY